LTTPCAFANVNAQGNKTNEHIQMSKFYGLNRFHTGTWTNSVLHVGSGPTGHDTAAKAETAARLTCKEWDDQIFDKVVFASNCNQALKVV